MFELFEVEEKDKNIIYNLMQLYTYELSFFEDETTKKELERLKAERAEKNINAIRAMGIKV